VGDSLFLAGIDYDGIQEPFVATQGIVKSAQICAALNATANPAVARLKAKLSPEFVAQLPAFGSANDLPPAALDALCRELNRVIQQDSLYDAEAFNTIQLKKATANLVELVRRNGKPEDKIFLNRQLVEQLFPGAIRGLQAAIDETKSRGTMLQDAGAVTGMFTFTFIASFFNRRKAFLAAFLLCLGTVSFVFYSLHTATDVYWMLPPMGFATLSVFAGYSIYFPELFPTRLRGTGVGLCYNTVRYLAAPFPFLLGWLSSLMPFRTVAIGMCSIYLLGIVALFWAPETKGQPLPED
jgi:hypothetical protein